jgi:hypothetical protein
MYSDGIHPVVSILTDPQYMLHSISTAVDILDNIQEEKSMFLELIVSVIVRKKFI